MSNALIILAILSAGTSSQGQARLPQSLDLKGISGLVVQHDGRWPPLDTVARDTISDVTGTMDFQGEDPVKMLLAWTFDAKAWMDQPVIKIANAELRGELQLPNTKTVFSYAELMNHTHLRSLIAGLSRIEKGRKMNPLEAKVSDINGKLITLQNVFAGQVIRPIPVNTSVGDPWLPITAPKDASPPLVRRAEDAWQSLQAAFLADDAASFAQADQNLRQALTALPAAYRPTPSRIATELRYNRFRPFTLSWQLMVVGALLAAIALAVGSRPFDRLATIGLIAGFAMVSYGLWLRWTIAGRIPASNMYESLLFLGWGMGAFAILAMLVVKHRLVPFTASFMGAVSLFLADILPTDPFVRPIVPVLADTFWMSIHVPVIMVSYSVLALGVLVAHAQLVIMATAPGKQKLVDTLDSLHYWYIHVGSILLFAGIVTGSMWAASSWGRYWGWDPKEVWSLVAFLGYGTILHVRISREQVPSWAYWIGIAMAVGLFVLVVPKLLPLSGGKILALGGTVAAMILLVAAKGAFATALKSILCFWLIIMTYVGVNYVLGSGLHSYGFGTGAVSKWMFLLGGTDLALMALFCVIYLLRRRSQQPSLGSVSVSLAG